MSEYSGISRRHFIGGAAGTAIGSVGLAYAAASAPAGQGEEKQSRKVPSGETAVDKKENDSRPIRVGLIRCDTHGMYYAALMNEHDPLLLLHPPKIDGKENVYSWQGGGIHNYFYTSYYDQAEMTVPSVDGFKVVKVWDENAGTAKVLAKVLHDGPKVCKTYAEVSDDVDLVFIADCNGDGSDHLRLATPGLAKGTATFVDKPFAYDVKDARKMTAMADKYNAPLMSLSMLRVLPQAGLFRNRFAEIGQLQFGAIFGGGTALAGQIHAICLAHHLFGTGVQSVQCIGREKPEYIHLDYGDTKDRPIKGVMLNSECGKTPHCAIYASAYGDLGDVYSPPMGDYVFPFGAAEILRRVKTMVRTRVAQVDRDEMIESIAVAEAARLAQKEKRRVCVQNLI